MKRDEIASVIRDIGIIPAIRVSSADDAHFAVEAVASGGIPIVEITMTVPGAVEVISELRRASPNVLVGAGTVLNQEAALRCAKAGAQFLVSPGFNAGIAAGAREMDLLVIAGALTPSELMARSEERRVGKEC